MIIETVKIERKEIGIDQVKEMLEDNATITAELFETGITDQENETTITLDVVNVVDVVKQPIEDRTRGE